MELKDKKIGFCLTGSFCAFKNTIKQIKKIVQNGGKVIPIMSEKAYTMDTKFGKAKDFINEIENITNEKIIHSIQDAELIGSKRLTDILIIAPCSGNTLAKLTHGIVDTVVTIAVKSHLRRKQTGCSCYIYK